MRRLTVFLPKGGTTDWGFNRREDLCLTTILSPRLRNNDFLICLLFILIFSPVNSHLLDSSDCSSQISLFTVCHTYQAVSIHLYSEAYLAKSQDSPSQLATNACISPYSRGGLVSGTIITDITCQRLCTLWIVSGKVQSATASKILFIYIFSCLRNSHLADTLFL